MLPLRPTAKPICILTVGGDTLSATSALTTQGPSSLLKAGPFLFVPDSPRA